MNDRLDYLDAHAHVRLGFFESIRLKLAAWRMKFTPLSGETKQFARWLEEEALPLVSKEGESIAHFKITADNRICPLGIKDKSFCMPDEFLQLGAFFRIVGVERLELDVRLEENQIEDIVVFLYAHRGTLAARKSVTASSDFVSKLSSGEDVEMFCTQVRLQRGCLCITYFYCLTRFSRVVLWFQRRHRGFGDYRAMFYSAPRYGLLTAVIALIPLVIYLANGSRWILVVVSILASATLYSMVYLFFMIVGSLEYDNEEKAFRLSKANRDLKRYAKRIQEDLSRAKTLQEKMLPDTSNMPVSTCINWASAFIPEREVGGDYFDAKEIDSDRVAVIFADVSGHGMSAAFITAILKSTFQRCVEDGNSLDDIIRRLNKRLYSMTPEDSFAAVFVAIYNHQTREFNYVNGGHSPEPLLIPTDPARLPTYLTDAPAMILGVLEDIDVNSGIRTLIPGDKVVMVTDGIVEAGNEEGHMYGTERLEELLRNHRDKPMNELVQLIIRDVDRFVGRAEQDDDRAILAFEIKRAEVARNLF